MSEPFALTNLLWRDVKHKIDTAKRRLDGLKKMTAYLSHEALESTEKKMDDILDRITFAAIPEEIEKELRTSVKETGQQNKAEVYKWRENVGLPDSKE